VGLGSRTVTSEEVNVKLYWIINKIVVLQVVLLISCHTKCIRIHMLARTKDELLQIQDLVLRLARRCLLLLLP